MSEVCPPAFRGDGKLAGRYVPLVLAQNFSHAPAPSARVRPCIFSTAKLAGARSRNRDYLEPAPAILKFALFLPFFFFLDVPAAPGFECDPLPLHPVEGLPNMEVTQETSAKTDLLLPGIDSDVFENANTITKWLLSQPGEARPR